MIKQIMQSSLSDFIPKNNEYYGEIYVTTNLINKKKYVGKTIRDKNRAKYYYGSGIAIIHAINKYGKKNFEKEVIERCSNRFELNKREQYWIKKLNTISPNGYNLAKGGDGCDGYTFTDDQKKKASENQIGIKNSMYGKKISDVHKKRISEANKGKITWNKGLKNCFSKESLKKISDAIKGKPSWNKGLKTPIETRKKQSESLKKRYTKQKHHLYGHKYTEEQNKEKGKAHLGLKHKPMSEIGKKNISNAHKGIPYFCSECNHTHFPSSKIGKNHLKYKKVIS